jgi:hypothetical protein
VHAFPHAPQFFWSVDKTTHACAAPVPQSVSPAGQTHLPPWQTSLARQGMPQPPQLPRSVAVSTHMSGVPHIIPAVIDAHGTHLPPTHAAPTEHAMPHAPQLPRSVVRSTQAAAAPVPQRCWPAGHEHIPFWQSAAAAQDVPHAPQLLKSLIR